MQIAEPGIEICYFYLFDLKNALPGETHHKEDRDGMRWDGKKKK